MAFALYSTHSQKPEIKNHPVRLDFPDEINNTGPEQYATTNYFDHSNSIL